MCSGLRYLAAVPVLRSHAKGQAHSGDGVGAGCGAPSTYPSGTPSPMGMMRELTSPSGHVVQYQVRQCWCPSHTCQCSRYVWTWPGVVVMAAVPFVVCRIACRGPRGSVRVRGRAGRRTMFRRVVVRRALDSQARRTMGHPQPIPLVPQPGVTFKAGALWIWVAEPLGVKACQASEPNAASRALRSARIMLLICGRSRWKNWPAS